jgi:hypothetical protein
MAKKKLGKGDYQLLGASILTGTIEGVGEMRQLELQAKSSERAIDTLNQRGELLLGSLHQKGRKAVASQELAYAASNVELSGTALDVIISTQQKSLGEQVAASIDLQDQKTQLAIQAAVARSNSKMAIINSAIGAATDYAMYKVKSDIRTDALDKAAKNRAEMEAKSKPRVSSKDVPVATVDAVEEKKKDSKFRILSINPNN